MKIMHVNGSKTTDLCASEDGFAATEFALLVPILLALFLGGVSAFDANRASASITRASAVMVDLATRQTLIDDDQRDIFFDTVESIAGRYAESADFHIVMSSVINPADDEDDDVLVLDWSEATQSNLVLTDDDLDDLDLPTIPNGDSVILVTVGATHSPLIGWEVVRDWNIVRTAVRRPRFSSSVTYVDDD